MVKPPTKSVSPEATPAIKPRQLNKLTKRLAKDPADEEAFVQLWDVYLEGEKWEDMAGLLEMRIPALSESREKVRALVKLAAILDEKLGDVKRSVDAYHQVLVLEPNNRRALWALGVLYHDLEDWEKVIEIYLLRINLAESLEEKLALRAQLAAIYEQRLQQEDQALMEYIRAARLAPQNVRVLLNMEKLATRTESFRELLAVYEDVVERIDRLELRIALYLKLARLYTQHLDDEDTANGYYRRALELAAGHINKLFSISTIYGEEEEWEELITTYTQLIRFAERPAVKSGLRREIARLYSHGLNDPTSAFYELVRVARYDPDQQGLVDELFTLGLEAERHLELAAVLEDVGSRLADPEVRVDLYTRLARLHLDELQNSEQARSVIARAMDLDPAHVPTQLVRFDLLQASREFEALAQALESFLSRPDLGDEVAKEQRKRLAKLYEEKLKNRERAVELYRQNLGQPAEPQAEEDREEILEQLYRRQGTWDELIKLLATRAKEATTPEAAAEVAIEIAEIYEKQLDQSDRAFFELLREIRSCPNLDRLQDELFRLGGETGFTTELSAVCQELTNSVDEQTSAELHMRLALLFENDGEPDEALENYQTALKLDPCQSVAYQKLRSRAENHFQWSDVAELDTIRAAHVKDPQEKVELLLSAAEISAEQLSDLNMATVIFGQVLKIDPQNQHAQKGLKALGQTVPGPDARAPLIDHDDEDDEPEMVTDVSTRPLIRPKADSDWNKKIDEQSSETAQEEELAEVVSLPRPPLDEMPGSETGETGEVFSPPATKPAPEPAGDDEVAEVFSPTRPPDPTAGAFPLDVGEDDYDDDSMEDREPTLVNRKPMALPDEDDEEKEPTLVTGPPPSPSTARLASTTDESIQDVLKEESLRQAEEKAQKEAKKKAKAEAKKKAKAEAKKKAEAETKKKAEAEAKKKAEQEAKKKAEAEAKKKAEAEAKKKAEKEAKKKAEAETKKKAEAEAKKKAEAEAKKKAEKEAKKKAEAETKKKAEAEAKKKAEAEAKKKAEKEAKKKAEQEAKKKAEAETKKKAEAEAKKKAEQEANKKAEEEAKKKAEQEAKKKAEQEAKKKAEEEAKKLAEEEAKKLAEEEAKKLAEEEAKKLAEEEAKKLAEEEAKKLAEEEAKKLAEEEAKKLAEEEAKKLAEEEAKKLAEEEAKKLAEKEAAQEDEPSAPAQPRDEEEETTLTEDDFEFFEEGEDEDFEEEDEGPMEEESTAPVDLVDPVITQRRIVEQKPDDVAAWEKLATLTTEHADNNKAFSVLEEGCAKLSQDDDRAQLFRRMALLSSDDELRLRLADLLREYDRLDDAESSYRAVLRSSPGSAGALDGLYGIYKIRGALERYDAILTRALNGVSEPRSRRALLLRRAQLRANRLDRLEDALTDLEQLLLADDSDLEALSLQEDIFERTERYEELVQAYEQHLPYSLTSEERVDLLCAIAIIQENQLGNQDQSLRYYRLAVEEDPTHLSSMDSLINLLERRRDWLGALKQLQLAVKAPHDPTVRSNFFFRMGKILEEQLLRPEESEEAYRQAIEGTAPSFEALQSLKQMARRRGDWVEVIHLGKRLVDITTADKERALVYCELARVWRDRLDNESESVQCYQKALECDGDNVEAGKVVAGARLRDRRHEEAHVLLARVAEQGSSDGMEAEELAIIHLKLAQTNEALDRSEDAEHSYEKALELAPGDNEILRQYGYFLARQQSWQKAVELYSTIIQEHEQDLSSDELADMHCLMAQGFDKLERQEDSAESYRKALKANDKHLPALRASIELARSLRRPRECVELMTRLRDLSPTPASRQKLSSQIGDMLHNTLHVPGEASVAYREALEYEPNNVELLEKLRRVLVHAEEYEQAVDVLEQLGHLAENDRQRARYLRIAGDIERERLDNDHRAMNLYIKALKAAPLDKRSHAAAVKILSRTRDWPRLARLYEELLRRLPPPIAGQDDRRLAILTELVELYRYRLDDGGRAIGACEQLLKIDPSQIKVREDLARLYEAEGKTSQAIKIHRLLIGDSPFSIDSYHALRRIYEAQGEADHTLCLVATLAFLDEADKDEMRMLKENRHALPIPSGRHLSEALYDRLLLHPKAGGLLGEMFSFAADFARSLFITPHKEYKLKGRDRLALDNRGDKIAEIFTRSLEFLGLPHPEIYGRGIGIKGIMAVNTSPIAVLYTEEALKRASIPELRFMVARALTFTRPENLLAASLTAKQLRTLLEALVELAFPGGPIHPVAEEVTGLARKLQRILPVRKQDRLMQLASRYREQAEDLSIRDWLEGVEHTCNRAGLAMAGDLEASVQVLKAARVVSPSGSHRALIRELIFYSISEDYFGLRKALKASI